MKNMALMLVLGILMLPAGLYGAGAADDGTQQDGQMVQNQVQGLVAAGLAPEIAQKAVQTMIRSNFSSKQMQAVNQTILAAHRQGLPTETLAAKLMEGYAKQATAAMMVRAVDHVADRYAFAYTTAHRLTADDRQRAALGNIMVTGMAAGLTHQNMAMVVDRLETRARQMKSEQGMLLARETLLTARDMARQGIAPDRIAQVVSRAVAQGLNADALRQARQAMSARRAGSNPEALARGYAQAFGQSAHSGTGTAQGAGQVSAGGQGSGAAGSGGGSGSGGGGAGGGSGGGGGGGPGGGAGGGPGGGGAGGGGGGGAGGT